MYPPHRTSHPENSPISTSDFGMLQHDLIPSWIVFIGASVLAAYILQRLMLSFELPALSIVETLWNCFVYLMPTRLVFALRPHSAFPVPNGNDDGPGQHAAKSEVLRNVFGLDKPRVAFHKSSSDTVPAGLGNWDNSCYQNSVLQSLASVRSLHSLFDSVQVTMGGDELKDTTLSALNNLIRDLNNRKVNARHLWTPPKLKSMSSWQQQDAQEYFHKIVEQLEKDIATVYRAREPSKLGLELLPESAVQDLAQQIEPRNGVNGLPRATSNINNGTDSDYRILNPLEGLLAQRVGCTKCGYSEGLSLVPFNCITLPLGREWHYDLRDCLEAFTALEYIDGVECAKCTLLQARHQLRELSETLGVGEEDEAEDTSHQLGRQKMVEARLEAVSEAIRDEDFTDSTLTTQCQIPARLRVTTTKSRQAIVARTPRCLVMHVNRSLFDESTGDQLKNYAEVQFGLRLDLTRWCVGNKQKMELSTQLASVEEWEMDPSRSMIQNQDCFSQPHRNMYGLQAVITHYGRHENGHYICYRKLPNIESGGTHSELVPLLEESDQWWRLSDEDVSRVSEEEVLAQGGVFMLFYERIMEDAAPATQPQPRISDTIANAASSNLKQDLSDGQEGVSRVHTIENLEPLPIIIEKEFLQEDSRSQAISAAERKLHSASERLPIFSDIQLQTTSSDADTSAPDIESPVQKLTGADPRRKTMSPPTMRTAGLPPLHADERSPIQPLRMVTSS